MVAKKAAAQKAAPKKVDDPPKKVVVSDESEKGFIGVEVDETPNENYTLAGVVAGKPTPENGA